MWVSADEAIVGGALETHQCQREMRRLRRMAAQNPRMGQDLRGGGEYG